MIIHDTKIDQLFEQIGQLIPDDMNAIGEEIRQNLKSAMVASLKNMDLVTREEFDIQSSLLARTRAKLEELEKTLSQIEEKMDNNNSE